MKKILIAGATGSMGRQTVQLVEKLPNCQLVAVLAPTASSSSDFKPDVKRFDNLAMVDIAADIWIDFTTPQAVYENTKFALEHHMHPIVGTSGLTPEQTKKLQAIAQKEKIGGIIVPNFGLSA
ncbi:MAG: 4-hydroxy-tetrahydrodipicolinate reductase, partial [Lactobacillus sp.]|nr:4-hydroxy-tetrahydrodipicolinate reductase [Lactobacillus sp.]